MLLPLKKLVHTEFRAIFLLIVMVLTMTDLSTVKIKIEIKKFI
jgi:hypothetical protein